MQLDRPSAGMQTNTSYLVPYDVHRPPMCITQVSHISPSSKWIQTSAKGSGHLVDQMLSFWPGILNSNGLYRYTRHFYCLACLILRYIKQTHKIKSPTNLARGARPVPRENAERLSGDTKSTSTKRARTAFMTSVGRNDGEEKTHIWTYTLGKDVKTMENMEGDWMAYHTLGHSDGQICVLFSQVGGANHRVRSRS